MKNDLLNRFSQLPNYPKFDLHHWADYLELKCLMNLDGVYSLDDFVDDFINQVKDLIKLEDSVEDNSKKSDQYLAFASDCFKVIDSRISTFKTTYPFNLLNTKRAVKLKKNLTLEQKKYLFLLFGSNLRYIKEYQNKITSSFELISLKILKKIFPISSEMHLFGSSNSFEKGRKYTGTLWNKIKNLSEDLNEGKPKAKKKDFPPTDSGDGGLDLIGWIHNGDSQPHLITFTGQAACTSKWDIKQFSSSYPNWKNKIAFSVSPINIVFIPLSLRDCTGEWHRQSDIGDVVLFDRQRLLYHYCKESKHFKDLPCFPVVNELIKLKTSIF